VLVSTQTPNITHCTIAICRSVPTATSDEHHLNSRTGRTNTAAFAEIGESKNDCQLSELSGTSMRRLSSVLLSRNGALYHMQKHYFGNYDPAGFGRVRCKLCQEVISSGVFAIRGHEFRSAKHKEMLNIVRLRKAGYDIGPTKQIE
jgi:hypothetical protein